MWPASGVAGSSGHWWPALSLLKRSDPARNGSHWGAVSSGSPTVAAAGPPSSSLFQLLVRAMEHATPDDAEEAARFARIAERAEQRAAERLREQQALKTTSSASLDAPRVAVAASAAAARPVYISKAERERLALERLEQRRGASAAPAAPVQAAPPSTDSRAGGEEDRRGDRRDVRERSRSRERDARDAADRRRETDPGRDARNDRDDRASGGYGGSGARDPPARDARGGGGSAYRGDDRDRRSDDRRYDDSRRSGPPGEDRRFDDRRFDDRRIDDRRYDDRRIEDRRYDDRRGDDRRPPQEGRRFDDGRGPEDRSAPPGSSAPPPPRAANSGSGPGTARAAPPPPPPGVGLRGAPPASGAGARKPPAAAAAAPAGPSVEAGDAPDKLAAAELEEARKRYMGHRPPRRRILRPSEKTKVLFQFSWDATDDTSDTVNPLYAQVRARAGGPPGALGLLMGGHASATPPSRSCPPLICSGLQARCYSAGATRPASTCASSARRASSTR